MTIDSKQLQYIVEAALLVAGRPLTIADLQKLFDETALPSTQEVRAVITLIQENYNATSGVELRELASGFQFQAKTELSPWLSKLWEERPTRYSRAILETLALVAYRQPTTRAEIEQIRGVAVSSPVLKTLLEREWIRVIGYRDTPGKPALYGTTKAFLDHFNLTSLADLPALSELKDLDSQVEKLQIQLELTNADQAVDVESTSELTEQAIDEAE